MLIDGCAVRCSETRRLTHLRLERINPVALNVIDSELRGPTLAIAVDELHRDGLVCVEESERRRR